MVDPPGKAPPFGHEPGTHKGVGRMTEKICKHFFALQCETPSHFMVRFLPRLALSHATRSSKQYRDQQQGTVQTSCRICPTLTFNVLALSWPCTLQRDRFTSGAHSRNQPLADTINHI